MFTRERRASYRWIRLNPQGNLPSDALTASPPAESLWTTSEGSNTAMSVRAPLSFRDALSSIGVPASNLSPEEELIDLLRNAAEIEHGLMIQYLYSTYSLRNLLIAGVLKQIAIEEMGHFITVQNLLIACSQSPYLGHSDWNDPSLFQPFPFRLEPASSGTLAKYTIAEMPDPRDVQSDIQADLPQIMAEADASAKSPVEAHRVGLLYAKIYWLLRASDEALPDPSKEPWLGFPVEEFASKPELAGRHIQAGFIVDATDQSALPEHWQSNHESVIVEPIASQTDALQSIAKISAQGEGFGETPQAHFERFVEAWRLSKQSPDLAIKAPTNPWYSLDTISASPTNGDEITTVSGREFARIGDLSYELILLATAANIILPPATAMNVRGKMAKAAIFAMRDCLRPAANALAGISLQENTGDDRVCGLPFLITPVEVGSELSAVVERARIVMAEMLVVVDEVSQGDGTSTLKVIAQAIGATVRDDISPKFESLAT